MSASWSGCEVPNSIPFIVPAGLDEHLIEDESHFIFEEPHGQLYLFRDLSNYINELTCGQYGKLQLSQLMHEVELSQAYTLPYNPEVTIKWHTELSPEERTLIYKLEPIEAFYLLAYYQIRKKNSITTHELPWALKLKAIVERELHHSSEYRELELAAMDKYPEPFEDDYLKEGETELSAEAKAAYERAELENTYRVIESAAKHFGDVVFDAPIDDILRIFDLTEETFHNLLDESVAAYHAEQEKWEAGF